MNIQIEAEPWGDMEQSRSFIRPARTKCGHNLFTAIQISFCIVGFFFPFFFLCLFASIIYCVQYIQAAVHPFSTSGFLELYIFQRRGIMKASNGGWPCASHCIGVLWLIELAEWKMKFQQGHAVQQAVSVGLREKREMDTHDRLPDLSRSLHSTIYQNNFRRPMEDDGLNWLGGLHWCTASGLRRK